MLGRMTHEPWKVLPEGTWLLQQPIQMLDLEQWNGFGFSTQLDGNSWLNMVYAKPNSLMQTTLTPGYYTALVIKILIFAFVALFVARRISRPLRHLAKSAERLGRGEELESLPEKGPDDIRGTVAAFNRMQIRLRRFLDDRTRMLAAIGHDLRTPITSLRLRTEFISDAETREKFAATLDEMQGMAEAALSFAQSESITEPTRVVNLNALLESICDDPGRPRLERGVSARREASLCVPADGAAARHPQCNRECRALRRRCAGGAWLLGTGGRDRRGG